MIVLSSNNSFTASIESSHHMRIVVSTMLLVLSTSLANAQTIDPPCKPPQQSDWEMNDLRGRIKSVRTFKTWFAPDRKTGIVRKGTPELEEEATYDPKGNAITWKNTNYLPLDPADKVIVEYGCDSANRIAEIRHKRVSESLFRRTVYGYDEKGRNREHAEYFADGTLERLETYAYDDKGNRIEEIAKQQIHPEHFIPKRYDVYVTTRSTFEYDSSGNKTKEIHFSGDGSLYATWLYRFDANKRLLKETRIDKIGRVEDEFVYQYDLKGRLVEEKHYANFCYQGDGQMCEGSVYSGDAMFYYLTKTTYEYDEIGNWIQQKQFSMGGEKKTGSFEPDHILSRRISYYLPPLSNKRLERTRR
jgi:hypothetical protein